MKDNKNHDTHYYVYKQLKRNKYFKNYLYKTNRPR